MIEKIKITKWVYFVSLILLVNSLLSSLTFIIQDSKLLEFLFGLVIYSGFVSPVLIFLLVVDGILSKNSDKKKRILLIVINLFIICLAYYYWAHLFDNLVIS